MLNALPTKITVKWFYQHEEKQEMIIKSIQKWLYVKIISFFK